MTGNAQANARREKCYHLALTTGLASVQELAAKFEVTWSIIRRNLALLNTQGLRARTYGWAMALGAYPEASLRQRTGEAFEQKQAFPRWAASVIQPGENALLDVGFTVGDLALERPTPGVSQSFVGPPGEAELKWMSYERVFWSTHAVIAEDGIWEVFRN